MGVALNVCISECVCTCVSVCKNKAVKVSGGDLRRRHCSYSDPNQRMLLL